MEGFGFCGLIAIIVCFLAPFFGAGGKKDEHTDYDQSMKDAGFRKRFINGKWYWVPKDEC